MKLRHLCPIRLKCRPNHVNKYIICLQSFDQKNFCSAQTHFQAPLSLRTPSSEEEKNRSKKQEQDEEESIIRRRKEEEYNRQEAILNELKELKEFILNNRNKPHEIINKLKYDVLTFDSTQTTSIHKCETMRRIIWLCTKYLSDSEWYNLNMTNEIEILFNDFTNHFIDLIEWFSMEELCDILWTYATLGFRPYKLINKIVSKIDRILLLHKKNYFGSLDNKNKNVSENDKYKAETFGYVPGLLKLPFKHSEFSDIIYSFGCLRIESGNLITLLDAIIMEHYPEKNNEKYRLPNRLLDGFLPRDLSNLCIGYAMMDPAFHWYKIVWGINKHLNILSNYISWTFSDKLNILHYDVCMRYINIGWKLRLTGEMAKLIDENFLKNLPRLVAPYYDEMNQEMYEILCEQVISDQYFCKNIEGFQIPFSRWEPRDEPAVIEPLNKLQFTRLDNINKNKLLLGKSLLKQNILKVMLKNGYQCIPYWEWPETNHLKHLIMRKKIKQLDMPLTIKQNLLQHTLEPHYKPLQKGLYD